MHLGSFNTLMLQDFMCILVELRFALLWLCTLGALYCGVTFYSFMVLVSIRDIYLVKTTYVIKEVTLVFLTRTLYASLEPQSLGFGRCFEFLTGDNAIRVS